MCQYWDWWKYGLLYAAELPDNKYYIFGKEGAKQLAKEMGCPLLAQIPLVQSICENGDKGEPSAVNVDSVTGQAS